MSDCSSNAMNPKRFEVCPSCEGWMIEHMSAYEPSLLHLYCLDCECSVTRELKKPKDMDILNCPNVSKKTGFEREYLSQYHCESCKTDLGYRVLEQRYQQLEQVARRLYGYIKRDADDSWSPVKEKIAQQFREQLEALGVDINA